MERGMRNKSYRRTEEVILRVFLEEKKNDTTMIKMAKKVGVCRATMYAHHHAIREMIPDYRRYMLVEYGRLMRKKMRRKNLPLKVMYFETLLFILRNRRIFEVLIEFGDTDTLVKMLEKLRPKITSVTRLPKKSEKIFRIYVSEVVEIIVEWQEKRFSEKEIDRVFSDIMYLTNTARSRLMPIE